jgi:hypothetical protein
MLDQFGLHENPIRSCGSMLRDLVITAGCDGCEIRLYLVGAYFGLAISLPYSHGKPAAARGCVENWLTDSGNTAAIRACGEFLMVWR